MICERCGDGLVTHVLVAREPANTKCEGVCPACIKDPDDDNWALILGFPGRDMSYESKTLLRQMDLDMEQHLRGLRELGALR